MEQDNEKILQTILGLRKRSQQVCRSISNDNKKFLDFVARRYDATILSNDLSAQMYAQETVLAQFYIDTNTLKAPPQLLDEIDALTEKYEKSIDVLEEVISNTQSFWKSLVELDIEEKAIDTEVKKLFKLLYRNNRNKNGNE